MCFTKKIKKNSSIDTRSDRFIVLIKDNFTKLETIEN